MSYAVEEEDHEYPKVWLTWLKERKRVVFILLFIRVIASENDHNIDITISGLKEWFFFSVEIAWRMDGLEG